MIHNDLGLLHDDIRGKALSALEEMRNDPALRAFGVTSVAISETLRELSTQMAYYSRGRMANIADVKAMYKSAGLYPLTDREAGSTNTWTLDSKHLRGRAVDLVPQKGGTYWWLAPPEVWNRMGEIGESHGLIWGGRWKHSDCPHYEV